MFADLKLRPDLGRGVGWSGIVFIMVQFRGKAVNSLPAIPAPPVRVRPCPCVLRYVPRDGDGDVKKNRKFATIYWKICFRLAVVNLQQNVVTFSTSP